jgi:short-subunit dehydrogenase
VSFKDKVVWITGATSGIGEALAHELSRRGATLALSARREELLHEVCGACERSDSHLVLPLDVTETDSVQPAADRVLERFGRVDVLINNAGISQRGLAVDTQFHVDRRIMNVNYFGAVALTKALLPSMLDRGQGHIVAVSSLLGKFGIAERSAYSGSKHALHGFFDSLRAEVHNKGIRVTIICPGFIHTNASRNALRPDGTPHGELDEDIRGGLTPEACAQQILKAIARGRREVYVAGREKRSVLLNRLAPNLFSRIVRRRKLK